jgi:hypothetical protein
LEGCARCAPRDEGGLQLATISLRHQRLDDTGPAIAGSVFGLGILL